MTITQDKSETMKAALVRSFVKDFTAASTDNDESAVITVVEEGRPRPTLTKNHKSSLLVKIQACSLSPGDILMAEGSIVFLHPSTFPYVPGMDVCGIVEQVSDDIPSDEFQVGDVVVGSNGIHPQGGLAEYMIVSSKEAVKKPPNVAVEAAAAGSNSAVTALDAVENGSVKGKRVLILGGSGGVGSAAIQCAKRAGAEMVATTSTRGDLCQQLGADLVLNYKECDWWTHPDFARNKLDVIIDTVGGGRHFDKSHAVLKTRNEGGNFVAVTGDDPKPDMSTWSKAIWYFLGLPLRPIATMLRPRHHPTYTVIFPGDPRTGRQAVLHMLEHGYLQIPLHETLPFTSDGVRKAFETVASGHAHGKVVVKM